MRRAIATVLLVLLLAGHALAGWGRRRARPGFHLFPREHLGGGWARGPLGYGTPPAPFPPGRPVFAPAPGRPFVVPQRPVGGPRRPW